MKLECRKATAPLYAGELLHLSLLSLPPLGEYF